MFDSVYESISSRRTSPKCAIHFLSIVLIKLEDMACYYGIEGQIRITSTVDISCSLS